MRVGGDNFVAFLLRSEREKNLSRRRRWNQSRRTLSSKDTPISMVQCCSETQACNTVKPEASIESAGEARINPVDDESNSSCSSFDFHVVERTENVRIDPQIRTRIHRAGEKLSVDEGEEKVEAGSQGVLQRAVDDSDSSRIGATADEEGYAMQCSAIQFSAVQCNAMQCKY